MSSASIAPAPGSPLDALQFRMPWRPYQQRVLDASTALLADRRLHVVAAPGSGKTVLGLELLRRIGRPALILSPTTPIRDQWLKRLGDFLPPGSALPPWASRDLGRPGVLTSVTYQALHTRLRQELDPEEAAESEEAQAAPDEAELAEVVRRLVEAKVGTVVLDEAHHLRKEWWKALQSLIAALPGAALISLTATPPYDVTAREWRRYEALCGPIDEEISAPELVRSGALCPHQDFVWALEVRRDEVQHLAEREQRVEQLLRDLLADEGFAAAVQGHPWMASPEPPAEAVLDEPERAVALLVYAKARGHALPAPLLHLLGADRASIPSTAMRWWQALLAAYLDGEAWPLDEAGAVHRDALAKRLRAERLLHRRDLRLDRSRSAESELSGSPAKIEACVRIRELERSVRGESLRQVILADHIRDEVGGRGAAAADLGAWPIFRALSEAVAEEDRRTIALLTGRTTVVHEVLLADLQGAVEGARGLETEPSGVAGFVRVLAPGNALVGSMTRLLARGRVRTLVGTRALLGEGWDAPCINSLVLASYAGSYVLTNQMRGRAIRADAAAPGKVASVWHLVAVAPWMRSGWFDLDELERRFEVFVGVGASRPLLESGIARLRLPWRVPVGWSAAVNEAAAGRLRGLEEVRRRWEQATGGGAIQRVLPGLRAERPRRFRRFVFADTLRRLLVSAAVTFGAVYGFVMQVGRPSGPRFALLLFAVACGAASIASLPALLRAAWIALRHLPVDGSLRQLAAAVHEALVEARQLQRVPGPAAVRVAELEDGTFSVALAGATYRDSVVFADALEEVLGPIDNPRYLVTRTGGWWRRREDVHAVPESLGSRKELAEAFHRAWRRRLGRSRLVYTRTPEGRRALLRARVRAFSAAFAPRTRRLDRWH